MLTSQLLSKANIVNVIIINFRAIVPLITCNDELVSPRIMLDSTYQKIVITKNKCQWLMPGGVILMF